jgi:hypothetical protein
MRKLYERLITTGAIAALVAIFFYQVTYGTNESSYQWGYKSGKEGYECSNYDADCNNGLGACDIGAKLSYGIVTPPGVPHLEGSVTNKTACLDGYVYGWKHWCNGDLSLCAKFVMSNVFPGVFANNQTIIQICLKDAGDNVPDNDTNNILSPLSKHCGGTIAETTPPVWKAFQDNSTYSGIETQSANTNGHFDY